MTHNHRNTLLTVAAVLVLTAAGAAAAGAPAGMTPVQLAQVQSMTGAAISPDGSRIAALRAVPRRLFEDEDGGNFSELVVIDVATGEAHPFITGHENVGSIDWLPDGSAVSFLAKRHGDEHRCLYAIRLGGGEATRLVCLETDIRDYSFSPDGRSVALVASEPESEQHEELAKKGFKQRVFEEDWHPVRVWLAELGDDAGDPEPLDLPGSAFSVHWSPDGGELAVALAPRPLIDDRYMYRKVHVVSLATGTVRAVVDNPGKLGAVHWSPDGQHLALISAADINDPSAGSLLVVGRDGGEPKNLTAGASFDASACAWLDNETLVFLAHQGVTTSLHRIGADGDDMELLATSAGDAVIRSFSLARQGRQLAAVASSPRHPYEVFAGPFDGGLRRLTNSNPWLDQVALARQEVVQFTARDGLELEGLLLYPLGYEEGRRYPLVLIVHGGPESHHLNGWLSRYSGPGQVLAARGFAVFYPNYRGSTGRGVAFSKLGQADAAGKEFDDLVDAVDHLVAMGLADTERVGITGGSYGGYATAWCSTRYNERFAAGVMFAGISDKLSKAGTTEIPQEERLVHSLRLPHEDLSFFLERSPIAHAEGASTPLLIAHGEADSRVHVSQALEMYRALETVGEAPVRLVLYPGEGHGNRNAAARFDFCLRLVRWMEHYLKGPGGDPPPYRLDYRAPANGWPEPEASVAEEEPGVSSR